MVCDLVQEHYEPGNQSKSYYQVWRRYVYPHYQICYRTMLRYIATNIGAEERAAEEAEELRNQLRLFDE